MFSFSKDQEHRDFLEEILSLLGKLGQKSEDEGRMMIQRYWEGVSDVRDEDILRETPYYWAMSILHHPAIGDNQPEWYLDARFMPPPEWIRLKYYEHK